MLYGVICEILTDIEKKFNVQKKIIQLRITKPFIAGRYVYHIDGGYISKSAGTTLF